MSKESDNAGAELIVTVRLTKAMVADIQRYSDLRHHLAAAGLDTRTMTCREEGGDLVYEGAAVTKGNLEAENG